MTDFAFRQLPKQQFNAILDIGCGTEGFTQTLTRNASFVLGVDYEPTMIKKAQALYGHNDHLSFRTADIRYLKGTQQTFDLITAFHPRQWIPAKDQHVAFKRISELLEPNGLCLILVSDQMNSFYKPLMEITKRPEWQQYIPANLEPWNWQTVTSISRSFSEVGLRPLNVFV